MNDDLLSIVVPVYNVAPYLDRSIQSILNQTYRNFELILVNDGSTDGSGEICAKYAKLDPRVRLIVQENQGAAVARRNGVRLAAGRYMTSIDPDDYVDKDLYEQFMRCRGNYDVIVSQWFRESEKETRRCRDTLRTGAYETPEDMAFLLRHLINVSLPGGTVNLRPGIAAYFWNKLFKTELVREVMEEISSQVPNANEDRPITYGVMLRCKSVLMTEICGYHYWIRSDSLAHVLDRHCDYIKVTCQLYNLVEPMMESHPMRDILMPQLQIKIAEDLTRGPARMGFPEEAQLQLKTPVFPFVNLLTGKQIVLYGAGSLGCSYRRQIQKWNACSIVLWVDKDWEEYARAGLNVDQAEKILDVNYDYVVISETGQTPADSIRKSLVSMGIENGKILWRPPFEL